MECMTTKPCAKNRATKIGIGIIGTIALTGAWYAFRPEKLFINETVNEAAVAPTDFSTVLARGQFHRVAHETKGQVFIAQLADGRRVLRFDKFQTSNGPDLRVLLVAVNDAMDSDAVKGAERIELAPLKGNIGNQNYDIPALIDLAKYKSVTVWCHRFGVNFATAPLTMES